MHEEIGLAAKWWSEQIQHRNTDAKSIESKKAIFEETVSALLAKKYKSHWFLEEPTRASGFRAIVNDLRCDPVLVDAAKAAGIMAIEERLPSNTRMFVNPGSVSVREGEDDSIVLHTCNQAQGSTMRTNFGEWTPTQHQPPQSQSFGNPQEFQEDAANGQQYTTQFLSDVKYGYSSLGNGRFAVRNENGQYEICSDSSQHPTQQQRLLKVGG